MMEPSQQTWRGTGIGRIIDFDNNMETVGNIAIQYGEDSVLVKIPADELPLTFKKWGIVQECINRGLSL